MKDKKIKRKYIYKESLSLNHYEPDSYTVRCVDDRDQFYKVWKNFLKKKLKVKHIDPKSPAGGAIVFSFPQKESDREYNLRELGISIRLHHVKKARLFSHHDCGFCGGFKAFNNDEDKEFIFHRDQHKKAVKIIKKHYPRIKVETYFIDRKGIIQTN